jgi:hypothetical protein
MPVGPATRPHTRRARSPSQESGPHHPQLHRQPRPSGLLTRSLQQRQTGPHQAAWLMYPPLSAAVALPDGQCQQPRPLLHGWQEMTRPRRQAKAPQRAAYSVGRLARTATSRATTQPTSPSHKSPRQKPQRTHATTKQKRRTLDHPTLAARGQPMWQMWPTQMPPVVRWTSPLVQATTGLDVRQCKRGTHR